MELADLFVFTLLAGAALSVTLILGLPYLFFSLLLFKDVYGPEARNAAETAKFV